MRKQQGKRKRKDSNALGFAKGFKRATEQEQLAAMLASSNRIDACPIAPCHWLHQYVEPRQSFSQWYSSEARNRVTPERNTIYFLPFGEFEDNADHMFDKLVAFARVYFLGMEVALLPTLEIAAEAESGLAIDTTTVQVRDKETTRQLHTPPILTSLQHLLPDDAYCLLAFTMEDLYDGQRDSFVVGLASLESRVGLFSFARYDPAFSDRFETESPEEDSDEDAKRNRRRTKAKTAKKGKKEQGEDESVRVEDAAKAEANRKILIARSCKVMAHEVFHMFNIEHCVYYSCCMNGSGHVSEDDQQPLHLCPVDLHKLFHALGGFEVEDRYRQLLAFYVAEGMTREAGWVESRLATLSSTARNLASEGGDGASPSRPSQNKEDDEPCKEQQDESGPHHPKPARRSSRLQHKNAVGLVVSQLARK